MTDEKPTAIVYANPIDVTEKKSKWFEWVAYYVYNIVRKPKVWKERKEVIKIAQGLQESLKTEVYPQIDMQCKECRDGAATLKSQEFTSNIHMILQRLACDTHPEAFNRFLNKHRSEFSRSDDISAWINGFRK